MTLPITNIRDIVSVLQRHQLCLERIEATTDVGVFSAHYYPNFTEHNLQLTWAIFKQIQEDSHDLFAVIAVQQLSYGYKLLFSIDEDF